MKNSKSEPLEPAALRQAAIDLLSRREHSRRELFTKLIGRSASPDNLESILDDLQQRGWQSDRRYCESYIRSKGLYQRIGPIRLGQELRQKGIESSLIREMLQAAEIDWFEQARECGLKKAATLKVDEKFRGKLYRFLAYRGFNPDQIQYAMDEAMAAPDSH